MTNAYNLSKKQINFYIRLHNFVRTSDEGLKSKRFSPRQVMKVLRERMKEMINLDLEDWSCITEHKSWDVDRKLWEIGRLTNNRIELGFQKYGITTSPWTSLLLDPIEE